MIWRGPSKQERLALLRRAARIETEDKLRARWREKHGSDPPPGALDAALGLLDDEKVALRAYNESFVKVLGKAGFMISLNVGGIAVVATQITDWRYAVGVVVVLGTNAFLYGYAALTSR